MHVCIYVCMCVSLSLSIYIYIYIYIYICRTIYEYTHLSLYLSLYIYIDTVYLFLSVYSTIFSCVPVGGPLSQGSSQERLQSNSSPTDLARPLFFFPVSPLGGSPVPSLLACAVAFVFRSPAEEDPILGLGLRSLAVACDRLLPLESRLSYH